MQIIVQGITGHMGRKIADLLPGKGHTLAAGISVEGPLFSLADYRGEADMVIDFSHHSATVPLLTECRARKLPAVIATTGHTPEERAAIEEAAREIPIFFSYNMSLGIALLARLAKETAKWFPDADIEIVEAHHNRKLDVPSGTALLLADAIREVRPEAEYVIGRHENGRRKPQDIGIHSLRLGNEVGTHEILVTTGTQTITLKHEAEDRTLFAEGALTAAEFLAGKPAGLYTMQDMMKG